MASSDPNPFSPQTGICFICMAALSETIDSEEHVIPNALGGRLRVRRFICARCNNETGYECDAVLASQLQPLCLIFDIARERGQTPAMRVRTTAGEELIVNSDGELGLTKPSYVERPTANGFEIAITARSTREARKMLRGVKKKHPALDIEASLATAEHSSRYPNGAVHFQPEIGGIDSGRSIVKTALSYAHHVGLADRDGDAAKWLREPLGDPPFGYYWKTDLVADRPSDVPLHCLAASSDPRTGLTLVYVEYFGIYRMVVCISRTYAGTEKSEAYAIDPRTGAKLDLTVTMPFDSSMLQQIYDYEMADSDGLIAAYEAVLPEAMRRNRERQKDKAMHAAFDRAWAECGAVEGEILTEAHLRRLSDKFVRELMPLMRHLPITLD